MFVIERALLAKKITSCSVSKVDIEIRAHHKQKFVGATGVNDPSAGSPTEALLRLVLPLSDKVY